MFAHFYNSHLLVYGYSTVTKPSFVKQSRQKKLRDHYLGLVTGQELHLDRFL